jgi:hypothetical protein
MADLIDEPEVKRVMAGVALLGVPIRKFVDAVTKVYSRQKNSEVDGFDFDSSDTKGLIFNLTTNTHFGLDNQAEVPGHLATKFSNGISFREVNSNGSYHFEISKLGANLHRDSISVVAGRDEHGYIIYDTGNLLQHLVVDHWNKPNIIAPNRDDGFVWGFRFGK